LQGCPHDFPKGELADEKICLDCDGIHPSATFVRAETWTGKLVDAICKASSEAGCPATSETHLFAIELPDSKVLILDARGNDKAAGAIHNAPKNEWHATVTGSREGQTVKVETIELR
jgi:hypothetical protein